MLLTLLALRDAPLSGAMFTAWDKSQGNTMFSVQKSRSRNFIACEQPGDMTRNGAPPMAVSGARHAARSVSLLYILVQTAEYGTSQTPH